MKSMTVRRSTIRKADRKVVKYSSFKQKDREGVIMLPSTLASPKSKAPMPRTHQQQPAVEQVYQLVVRIHELLEARKFKSDELFQAVDALKALLSQVNNEAEKGGSTACFQAVTQPGITLLCRLMTNLVSESTQIKVMGIFAELAYSQHSDLILKSPDALSTIIRGLVSTTNAIRLRAVGCIANLAGDGAVRNQLIGTPEVVTGLIQNLQFEYKANKDIAMVVIARDVCWAINNLIATQPAIKFDEIEIFLDYLVNAMARLMNVVITDPDQVHYLIRFGLRALEKALEMASNEKIECSLQNNSKLAHLLSWCMRYRHNAPFRDIIFTALNCMRYFSMEMFLKELFITDIPKILYDERMLRSEGAPFLDSWCITVTCMMKRGMSNEMLPCTVTRIANGLHTIMTWKFSNHVLRRNACHAMNTLGRSIEDAKYVNAFWAACGGNGLLVALSMENEVAVSRHALLAMDKLLPTNPAATSKYLLAKPDLQTLMREAVKKLTESEDAVTNQKANVVLTKLEQLENEENKTLDLDRWNVKTLSAPSSKRRRVGLGEFNA